jgi:hypothetical protein
MIFGDPSDTETAGTVSCWCRTEKRWSSVGHAHRISSAPPVITPYETTSASPDTSPRRTSTPPTTPELTADLLNACLPNSIKSGNNIFVRHWLEFRQQGCRQDDGDWKVCRRDREEIDGRRLGPTRVGEPQRGPISVPNRPPFWIFRSRPHSRQSAFNDWS